MKQVFDKVIGTDYVNLVFIKLYLYPPRVGIQINKYNFSALKRSFLRGSNIQNEMLRISGRQAKNLGQSVGAR